MTDLSPDPQSPPHRPPRRRGLLAVVVGVVVIAAVAAWYFFGRSSPATPETGKASKSAADGKGGKAAGKGGGRFGADPNRVQPVAAAAARTADVPIVQTALGTATALRTVTVKPRVDGQLQSVNFTEGQMVKAGDLLAQIDPVPLQVALAQSEGTLARDAAQLNNARLDLERYRTLLTQDSIAQQQVDQQAALVRQLEGTVKVSQAQVDNARLQLSYTRITAPIAGRTGLRVVDAGNQVRGSDANGVAVITQVDPISVVFTIPQDTLPRVLARLAAGEKPPVEAWDREQKNLLTRGALVTTDNQIDVATGTVRLKAQFPNPEGKLFPNQFVNVRMVVDVRKGVVVVPSAAIQRGAQGTVVYVVKEDSTVTLRPITAGATEGQVTEVVTGLQAGERVITDGVDRIREGVKVEVTEPGGGARGGASPRASPKGEGGKGMDPAKREEMRKRLEAMTPEQREEFRKRREAAKGQAAPEKTAQ
jgi:multidrug efflux system membrane fusion protein